VTSATYDDLTELANIGAIEVSPQKRTDRAFERRHDCVICWGREVA